MTCKQAVQVPQDKLTYWLIWDFATDCAVESACLGCRGLLHWAAWLEWDPFFLGNFSTFVFCG